MKNKIIIRLLIAGIVILVIALIATIIVYFTTDLLKPANQLFSKYFQKDLANLEEMVDISSEDAYIQFLQGNNYNDNTTIALSYKNSVEVPENFNITVEGSTDNQNKNSYRKINVKYGENAEITNIEYLQENNLYGLLFPGVIGPFATVDLTDKEAAVNKLHIDQKQYTDIINKYKISDIIKALKDKKQSVIQVINNHKASLDSKQFSKRRNKIITLSNGESAETNEYSLKLSSDQTKKLFRDIAKELEDEELIEIINTSYREFPTSSITIYVQEDKTVRTVLEFDNRTIKIDLYQNQLYAEYEEKAEEQVLQAKLTITKQDQNKKISYEDSRNNIINAEILTALTTTGAEANLKFSVQTEAIKGIDVAVQQKLEQSDNIQIEKKFENTSKILLTDLESSALNKALSQLIARINANLQTVQNNNINSQLLNIVIEFNSQLKKKYEELQDSKENRYNNQFLLYQGNNVEKNIVYNLMDVVGKNIKDYRVNEKNELKIYLQEGNVNEAKTKELKEIVKNARSNYNINFEFDSNGKVSIILLRLYEKQN